MYQSITIVGNLGRDPEMRYMPDGTAVTNISVATSRRWTSKDGVSTEETTWFRVEVWGKQAESCNQYLSRGSKVLVEGTLKPDATGGPRTFTRQDGTVGATFELRAKDVRFLSGRDESEDAPQARRQAVPASTPDDIDFGDEDDDDIPF